ncbi:zf-HC2 domain-containing protein [Streptomyces sp. NPDC008121]|uniref:anti-sigma factor family protein n=1 Tax=Streptomyces sp. NPDC008121 TaxID=3364809 RepID=UPI0036F191E8
MSGSRPVGPTPAEQHLGDRLAALVDGELGHDARERVLAHLATCAKCKAEADAQRRLKSVFASTAPPPPSAGLLARLQGLPGGPGDPGGDDRRGGGFDDLFDLGGTGSGGGIAGMRSAGFATAAPVSPRSGFRIHEVGPRAEHDRSPWRGRRFGIAAASAVSFAAIALGGALPLEASVNAGARGAGTGNNVTPQRAAATGVGGTGTGTAVGTNASTAPGRGARSGERPTPATAAAPGGAISAPGTIVAGPLVPGGDAADGTSAPVMPLRLQAPATQSLLALSPFIRPTGPALRLAFAPGPLPAAGPTVTPPAPHQAAPGPTATPLTAHR